MCRRTTFRDLEKAQKKDRMLLDYILSGIMSKRIIDNDIYRDVIDDICISTFWDSYVVILLHIDITDDGESMEKCIFDRLPYYNMDIIFNDILPQKYNYIISEVNGDIVFIVEASEDDSEYRDIIRETIHFMSARLMLEYGIKIKSTCSDIFSGISELRKAYEQTIEILSAISIAGYDDIHFADEIEKYHLIPIMPVEEIDQRIINYTRVGDIENLKSFLNTIFDDWEQNGISIYAAQGIACSIFCQMTTAMQKYYEYDSTESFQSILTDLVRENSFYRIKNILLSCADKYCKQMHDASNEYMQYGIIEEIDKVIGENLFDISLNISFIAEQINMNPKYISAIYKERTGIGILETINKKRIEHFKELIKQNISIKEAAKQSGYCSIETLNRWFIRLEGTTPSKMKNSYNYIKRK